MTETAIPRAPRYQRDDDIPSAREIPDDARATVERWCVANRDRIVACYITPRRDHLLVAVIGPEIVYDNQLGDEVAGLEGELLDAKFRVESTLLPNVSLAELTYFIHPTTAVRVDAEKSGTCRQSGIGDHRRSGQRPPFSFFTCPTSASQ